MKRKEMQEYMDRAIKRCVKQAVAEEREACAKIVEQDFKDLEIVDYTVKVQEAIAQAIRKRGDNEKG